jgi:hypothetical protein
MDKPVRITPSQSATLKVQKIRATSDKEAYRATMGSWDCSPMRNGTLGRVTTDRNVTVVRGLASAFTGRPSQPLYIS